MKHIKSHWKLSYTTFKKAVAVTFTTAFRQIKLWNSLARFEPNLKKRREFIQKQFDKIEI